MSVVYNMSSYFFPEVSTLKIYCLGKPSFIECSVDDFLEHENVIWNKTLESTSSERLVEFSGRICYMSFGEKQSPRNNLAYISNLIEQGHESVLEHVNWTFLITGVSRAFTHQLVRHRIGFSYSQLSQQYHDESDAKIVVPPSIKNNPMLLKSFLTSAGQGFKTYQKLIKAVENDESLDHLTKKEKLREVRSSARSVLPNATETKIVVTGNARSIRHFLDVRGAIDGDWEMRAVATELFKIVNDDAPSLFQDFKVTDLADGSTKVVRKVIR